ncbi:sensor histidine kinase [Enterococcus sp. AZ109]|uniref:sensor histidine kinase n=1 Tax=Enterococcus sp. AZ109 TaxID=2774634 RepID=UPI003F26B4A8
MTRFFTILSLNFLQLVLFSFALSYGAHQLFKVPEKKKSIIKDIAIITTVLTVSLTMISFIDLWHQRYLSTELAFVTTAIQYTIYLLWLKRYTNSENFRLPLVLLAFYNCIYTITLYVGQYISLLNEASFLRLSTFQFFLIHILMNLTWFTLAIFATQRLATSYTGSFQRFLQTPRILYSIIGLYFSLDIVSLSGLIQLGRNQDTNFINLFISGVFLLLLVFIIFITREIDRNYHLTYSQKMLAEQQHYVDHIETLYNDLQKLHHDHKNLLSGMYFQVSEGNLEEVKAYLSEKLLITDEQLQGNLRQQRQLSNVKILEVKSLLFTKILLAKEHNVTLNLEVLEPIHSLAMEMNDFIRVFGIVLDNAIEAAGNMEGSAIVDVLLIQEEKHLEVLVKNPCPNMINLEKIWQLGYSTKGDKRGIGLATYKEILSSYDNVLQETQTTGNKFSQKMIISQ